MLCRTSNGFFVKFWPGFFLGRAEGRGGALKLNCHELTVKFAVLPFYFHAVPQSSKNLPFKLEMAEWKNVRKGQQRERERCHCNFRSDFVVEDLDERREMKKC